MGYGCFVYLLERKSVFKFQCSNFAANMFMNDDGLAMACFLRYMVCFAANFSFCIIFTFYVFICITY